MPADLATDLEAHARIQGAHVDIGAFETAPEPAATLDRASLWALAGLAVRRRRLAPRAPCTDESPKRRVLRSALSC